MNDWFFDKNTVTKIDDKAKKAIADIDGCSLNSRYKIISKFNGAVLDIDKLSTGCKTALNIMYYPEQVFSVNECGDNAISYIYQLKEGNVYSSYPIIPFINIEVRCVDDSGQRIIKDYGELKDWWEYED